MFDVSPARPFAASRPNPCPLAALLERGARAAAAAGVAGRVRFVAADIFDAGSLPPEATVLFLYMLPAALTRLSPALDAFLTGAPRRAVIAVSFPLPPPLDRWLVHAHAAREQGFYVYAPSPASRLRLP